MRTLMEFVKNVKTQNAFIVQIKLVYFAKLGLIFIKEIVLTYVQLEHTLIHIFANLINRIFALILIVIIALMDYAKAVRKVLYLNLVGVLKIAAIFILLLMANVNIAILRIALLVEIQSV